MTLAVARCFPTWELVNFERDVGRTMFDRAVIMASDSLYTTSKGKHAPEFGRKIFVLARNCAAVIAGHVDSAREALQKTKSRADKLDGSPSLEDFSTVVHECFREIGLEHYPVECLIGLISSSGKPVVLKVSSGSGFDLVISRWHDEIGAYPALRQTFRELIENKTRLSSGRISPAREGLRVVEALHSTIETHRQTLRAPVQALVITEKEGVRPLAVSEISVSEIPSAGTVKEITPPPDNAPGLP